MATGVMVLSRRLHDPHAVAARGRDSGNDELRRFAARCGQDAHRSVDRRLDHDARRRSYRRDRPRDFRGRASAPVGHDRPEPAREPAGDAARHEPRLALLGASTDNVSVTGYRFSALCTRRHSDGDGLDGHRPRAVDDVHLPGGRGRHAGNARRPRARVRPHRGAPADTTPPSAPTNLSVTPAREEDRARVESEHGNVGVAGYRVIRDDKQVAQTQTTTYTDTLGGKTRQ